MVALEHAQTHLFDHRPITVVRPTSEDPQAPPLIALHGWTGDEHSMEIFIRRMAPNRWIFAPRAPYTAEPGGYAWVPPTPERPAPWETFAQSALKLKDDMVEWLTSFSLPAIPIDLMGFSQGAAMALTFTLLFPERVNRLVILAGFLPNGGKKALRPGLLSGKACFLAHGYDDEIVPLERAKECIEALETTGARVITCLDNVGHRVSTRCLHAMLEFLGFNAQGV